MLKQHQKDNKAIANANSDNDIALEYETRHQTSKAGGRVIQNAKKII